MDRVAQVETLHHPARDFQLAAAALPAVPKWGRACDWSPRDDAMLLLGVNRYGIDHWDKCVSQAPLWKFARARSKVNDRLHSSCSL